MTRRLVVGLAVALVLVLVASFGCAAVRGFDAALAEAECGGPR